MVLGGDLHLTVGYQQLIALFSHFQFEKKKYFGKFRRCPWPILSWEVIMDMTPLSSTVHGEVFVDSQYF